MKKTLVIMATILLCAGLFAEGYVPLENVSTGSISESKTFNGNNGDSWTVVGLRNSTVGEYKALTIQGSVSGNGISGTLGTSSVDEGIGEVKFSISGANSATKGYGVNRMFVVKAGGKTVNVTGNVKVIGTVYELSAEIKMRDVSTLSITMQEGVSGEDIRINIFNVHWTSYDGKTDMPTITIDGSNSEYIANAGDTTYYAADNVYADLASTSEGSVIYYTTDGSTPTKSSSSATRISISAGSTVTLKVGAWTSDKGMSDIVTKTIKTAVGKVTQNPCSETDFWPDCSIASKETEDRGSTKSGTPYFRIKSASVIYTPAVPCPAGLSLYAAKKSEASITIAYQTGNMVIENGNQTWVGSDWYTLRELTKNDLTTTMQRFEIPLTGIKSTDIVRFRIKSGGISLYVDDINYIEQFTEQTATPNLSIPSGEVVSGTKISLSGETGSVIYYSTDGGNSYSIYTEALTISSPLTLLAYAIKEGKSTSWTVKGVYTISDAPQPQLNAPTFSIMDGSEILWGDSVTIQVGDPLATLHYSINGGNEETTIGNKRLVIKGDKGASFTINAYLTREGFQNSPVSTASYTIVYGTLPAPTFSEEDYASLLYGSMVTISSSANVRIIYSINGKSNVGVGNATFSVTEDMTVTAYAAQDGHDNSETVTRHYIVILPKAAEPVFDIPEGEIAAGTTVKVVGVKGDTIYYRINDDEWTYLLGGASWTITQTTTISAYRAHEGMQNSDTVSITYSVPKVSNPVFSLIDGAYESGTIVTITVEEGAIIHYTINGVSEYVSPSNIAEITITGITVISAYATKVGKTNSDTIVASYTIKDIYNGIEVTTKSKVKLEKIIRNGQILILRNGVTYTVGGQKCQ